ncbi:MAG: hypothetical protein ABGX84_06715 [Alcanivorax sp.]
MNNEPTRAYVYQPMAPRPDGKFYGVGGLAAFGLSYDESNIQGITKQRAEGIAAACNQFPSRARSIAAAAMAEVAGQ